MSRLRADFGCSTIAQAKKKLAKLEQEVEELEREYQTKLTTFEKEYEHYSQQTNDNL